MGLKSEIIQSGVIQNHKSENRLHKNQKSDCQKMEDLHLYGAILTTLVVILLGLMFLKSQSSNSNEVKTGAVRRRAAIPNRDEDGQIVASEGPRQRGGPGGGRR